MIDNLFEIIVILWALVHSRFARLPLLVVANIIVFTSIKGFIEWNWHIQLSPGYEIYYFVSALYFACIGGAFLSFKNKFYAMVGAVLLVQSLANGAMLFSDNFAHWHDIINEKMLLVECLIVWVSSVRIPNAK